MKNHEQHLLDLLILKLQALYDIEQEVIKALPTMAKKASSPELRGAFEMHLRETEGQVARLEQSFGMLEEKPKKLKSDAIRGLIKDAKWVTKNVKRPEVLDANLIAAARYVEHYEMAGYMSAIDWANTLKEEEVADILSQTLEEEKAAEEKLVAIGAKVNFEAAKLEAAQE